MELSFEERKVLAEFIHLVDTHSVDWVNRVLKHIKPDMTVHLSTVAWIEKDLDILKNNYGAMGANITELRVKFTAAQVNRKAHELGLSRIGKKVAVPVWSSNEIALIKEMYSGRGANIPELLKTKSKKQIQNKARALGIGRSCDVWSEEEVDILRQEYPVYGACIPKLLNLHTKNEIRRKAGDIGLCVRDKAAQWASQYVDILREKYPKQGSNIPELLNVFTRKQIYAKAYMLHLTNIRRYSNRYTEQELQLLRDKYPLCGANIPELLEQHTTGSISAKTYELGLRITKQNTGRKPKWTTDQVELLMQEYPLHGSNIPKLLESYSDDSIRAKAHSMGLHYKIRAEGKYTEQEIKTLKEEYPLHGTNIPELLKRHTVKSIAGKAYHLGLRVTAEHIPGVATWTADMVEILRKEYPLHGTNIPELLKYYSRPAIYKKAYAIGVRYKPQNDPNSKRQEA